VQIASPAVLMPLYCAWHLSTSPAETTNWDSIRIHLHHLQALPPATIAGYIVPTFALALPAPAVISYHLKQQLLAFWQAWPLWTSLFAAVLAPVFAKFGTKNPRGKGLDTVWALRWVYAFGFACAAGPHFAACVLSFSSAMFPTLFNSNLVADLHPARVFVPVLPWSSAARPSSLAEGTLWFFQWDYLIASVAVLLWAVSLNIQALQRQGIAANYFSLALKAVTITIAAGPCAAALVLIWERDELVISTTCWDISVDGDSRVGSTQPPITVIGSGKGVHGIQLGTVSNNAAQ
jgi:hypothetical protein